MKKILLAVALLTLVGCEKETVDTTDTWSMPDGLAGCKVYRMTSSTGYEMRVVRCSATPTEGPTTATAYKDGKVTKIITVVETVTTTTKPEAPAIAQPEAPEAPK